MKTKIKLSKTQFDAFVTLNAGGRVFLFDDGTVGLDDLDSNTLPFRKTTFNILLNKGLLKVIERPSEGVVIYHISVIAVGLNEFKNTVTVIKP